MAIAQWQYFLNLNPQDADTGSYLVFEADSQTEILDWLKREDIPKTDKEGFIYSLINFKDDCGGFYEYRAYLLAAKYIKQFSGCIYAEEIIEQLTEWSRGYFWCDKHQIDFSKIIAKKAKEALKTIDLQKAIATYEKTIQLLQQPELKIDTAQKLLELDPNNEIAIAAIKNKLISSNSNSELLSLVGLCNEHKIITSIAIKTLIKLPEQIKPDDLPEADAWVGNTFYYLNGIAVNNNSAVNALIIFLNRIYSYNGYIFLIELALESLAITAKDNSNAIAFLENFILNNSSGTICSLSTRALWTINPGNSIAVDAALKLLDDKNELLASHGATYSLLEDNRVYINLLRELLDRVVYYLIKMIYQDYQFQKAQREYAELVRCKLITSMMILV